MIVQVCTFFEKTQQEHDVENMAILRRFIVIEKNVRGLWGFPAFGDLTK